MRAVSLPVWLTTDAPEVITVTDPRQGDRRVMALAAARSALRESRRARTGAGRWGNLPADVRSGNARSHWQGAVRDTHALARVQSSPLYV